MKPKVLLLCSVLASFAQATVAQKRSVNSPLRLAEEGRLDATVVSKHAATLAANLANDQGRKQFDATPFSALTDKATFRGDHWQWQSTVGYGKGDLRATVSFRSDGSEPKVEIMELVNEEF